MQLYEKKTREIIVEGKKLTFETGRMAMLADGSVLIGSGGTLVLVTAVCTKDETDRDYFPLMVDVEERMYAAGKIPGGFFRREGKPSERSILNARLIDRPIRPLFDERMKNEVHIVATILSVDQLNPPDVLSVNGASLALMLSDIPFNGPVAAARFGRIEGDDGKHHLVFNPTFEEMEKSDIDLTVAGVLSDNGKDVDIIMVECEAEQIPEEDLIAVLDRAKEPLRELLSFQKSFSSEFGKAKREIEFKAVDMNWTQEHFFQLPKEIDTLLRECASNQYDKQKRMAVMDELKKRMFDIEPTDEELSEKDKFYNLYFEKLVQDLMRKMILEENIRIDGRRSDEIRPIECEVGILPRTHGSALFTRGETQILSILTLGSMRESQSIDDLSLEENRRYLHHYNFPPFSVGEAGAMRGPRRREIGHGALAEKALRPMIPDEEEFPYTLRLVSEALSSNGSTSMASVCGSTLSLMDAGVPLKDNLAVAGIAMGLVKEGERFCVLSDIQGIEDSLGDMDFKVAGTKRGVTALQMDIKVPGISISVLEQALRQAWEGRMYIMRRMAQAIEAPRQKMSQYAPRVLTVSIPTDKIRDVIGSGGKVIQKISAENEANIDIGEDGRVFVTAKDEENASRALKIIEGIVKEVKVGEQYSGVVTRIMSFGAFVEYAPGKEGLIHISRLSDRRLENVEEVLKSGQKVNVEIDEIDNMGRVNLIAYELYRPSERGSRPPQKQFQPRRKYDGPKRDDYSKDK